MYPLLSTLGEWSRVTTLSGLNYDMHVFLTQVELKMSRARLDSKNKCANNLL